ncbi:hypothetical protein EDB86DRAFT_2834362 [Lactarius hatsudake]|nr:hypothetical protein EDB86DRAFT_2834362 [Lactarius hatsudake]
MLPALRSVVFEGPQEFGSTPGILKPPSPPAGSPIPVPWERQPPMSTGVTETLYPITKYDNLILVYQDGRSDVVIQPGPIINSTDKAVVIHKYAMDTCQWALARLNRGLSTLQCTPTMGYWH